MKKPYYDHDFLWEQRLASGNPVWGSNSHRVYREVLTWLASYSSYERRMLDIGCGAGAFGIIAAQQGYTYVGVDASEVGISLGKQHHPHVKLYVCDFATPDISVLGDELFPIITSVNVLHCLTGEAERHQFLANLSKVASAEALVILTTMVGPVDDDAQEKRLPRAYRLPEEIVAELAAAGWTNVQRMELQSRDTHSRIGNLHIACSKS